MRLSDPAALEIRLASLHAQWRHTVLECNTYFDTPAGDLRRQDQGLRLRIETAEDDSCRAVILAYKGPRAVGPLKSRRECEVHVTDADNASQLLEALGYKPILMFEKRRRCWYLDRCVVDIDRLPLLGDFVEIEGPDHDTILAVRRKLRLDHVALVSTSYLGLLLAYLDAHGLHLRRVTFESAHGG